MTDLLIVDDDITFCMMLKSLLKKNNYNVKTIYSPIEAKSLIKDHFYEVILSDMRMPGMDGLQLLNHIKQHSPRSRVIMMTAYADVTSAIDSIKRGAFDYIPKPLDPEEVLNTVKEAINYSSNSVTGTSSMSLSYFEGTSEKSKQLQTYIQQVAPTPMSVLLRGESGTGKEYIARIIHEKSSRKHKPFVAVDCGTITKELAASEFFGHLKGSFTGAFADKTGQFEAANGGTLFMDEVGNLTYETQVQLLRALQERTIKKVGSTTEIAVDVRIIAATNENLYAAMANGNFRKDLYHRLNEFQLIVPSLRDRKSDIMQFAAFFLKQANEYLNKSVQQFNSDVEHVFQNYSWPGNLRELKNVVKRATLLAKGNSITLKELPVELYQNKAEQDKFQLFKKNNEPEMILKALEATEYNKSKAARLLKVDRKTLYNKLKLYDIEIPQKE